MTKLMFATHALLSHMILLTLIIKLLLHNFIKIYGFFVNINKYQVPKFNLHLSNFVIINIIIDTTIIFAYCNLTGKLKRATHD